MRVSAMDALQFPWADAPAEGTRRGVCDGIDWVRLPLPFRLDHVNCWWLDGGDGETVQIDTGIASERTRTLWTAACDVDPATLLVTHFHPDHAGLVGDYAARGVTVIGSETEMRLSERIRALDDEPYGALYADWYARHGLPAEVVDAARTFGNGYRKIVAPTAPLEAYRWLGDGDSVTLAGRRWDVLHGRGHAPAMLLLHDAEAGVLIAADQVLPTISPNVSAGPSTGDHEPAPFGLDRADPLADFLDSLERLAALPEDTLVLPSHGLPFRGLHARLAALAAHHENRLAAVLAACDAPRTAAELFPVLFGKRMDAQQMSFALGEALAHAEHLVGRGSLVRSEDGGVVRFVAR